MNRRALLGGFAAMASGLLVPEPDTRRVYSFLWSTETEYDRIMRQAQESIRRHFEKLNYGSVVVLPKEFDMEILPGSHVELKATGFDGENRILRATATVWPTRIDVTVRFNSHVGQFS